MNNIHKISLALFSTALFSAEIVPPYISPENSGYQTQKYEDDVKEGIDKIKTKKAVIQDLTVDEKLKGKAENRIKGPSFVLLNVSVTGNTVFEQDKIVAIIKPFVEKSVDSVDLKYIAEKITNLYKENGYITSSCVIPKQTVKNGAVKFEIIENVLGGIAITGDNTYEYDGNYFAKFFKNLQGKPINSKTLNEQLKKLNYLPVARISPSLSKVNEKVSNLVLNISEAKERITLSFDNYGSYYSGENRVTVSGTKNNLFGRGSRLFLTATSAENVQFYNAISGQFSHPIGRHGAKLTWGLSKLSYQLDPKKVGTDLVLYEGGSSAFNVMYSKPLFWLDEKNLWFSVGFENRSTEAKTLDNRDGSSIVNGYEKYSVLSIGASLDFIDSTKAYNSFNFSIKKALPSVLGAITQTDITHKNNRLDGNTTSFSDFDGPIKYGDNLKADFTKYYASYMRHQTLPYDFFGVFNLRGEYTGARILQGYEYAAGDYGYAYSFALNRAFFSNILSLGLNYSNTTVFTYTEQLDTNSVSSQGLGASAGLFYEDFFLNLSYSQNLDAWDSNTNNLKFSGGYSW